MDYSRDPCGANEDVLTKEIVPGAPNSDSSNNISRCGNHHADEEKDPAPSLPAHCSPAFKPDNNNIKEPSTNEGLLLSFLHRLRARDPGCDLGGPPDGGLEAWSQSITSHLVIFNTWGYINSFGVFQTYYTHVLNRSPSAISWVGSVMIFLLFFLGTYSGRATDAGYFKLVFSAGAMLQVLGAFMTSISTKYWHLFLAQGLCTGIGNGLVFTPTVTVIAHYFLRKRSLAISFAAAGAASGGMVFPAIVKTCLHDLGFGWTVRIMAFVILLGNLTAACILKPRLGPRKAGPIVEWTAFRELPYTLYTVGSFLAFWGLYVAFFYVGKYGRDVLGLSQPASLNQLIYLNGVGFVARIIPGFLADRVTGPLNMYAGFVVAASAVMFCWAAVRDHLSGLVGFSVAYGVFGGGIQSLFPSSLSTLNDDPKRAGVRLGMVFSVVSFAALTGSPIAGALIAEGHGSYLYAQIWAGGAMLAGFGFLAAARMARTGWRVKAKV